jgi:hypothetical protein
MALTTPVVHTPAGLIVTNCAPLLLSLTTRLQVTKDEIAAAEGRQMEEDRAAEQDIAQQPGGE